MLNTSPHYANISNAKFPFDELISSGQIDVANKVLSGLNPLCYRILKVLNATWSSYK
jgi:hypothetical protein